MRLLIFSLLLGILHRYQCDAVHLHTAALGLNPTTAAAEQLQADQQLSAACSNPKYSAFLQCRKTPQGTYAIQSGTFGAGVVADVVNDPSVNGGVTIYENCPFNQENNTYGALREECKKQSGQPPKIPVFMKIVKPVAEDQNQRAHRSYGGQDQTAFDKEVRRSRSAALIRLDGHRLAPSVYDFGYLNQYHELQKDAFFQQFLDAETSHSLLLEAKRFESIFMEAMMADVFTKFSHYLKAQTQNNKDRVHMSVVRARTEIFYRLRNRVRFVDTVLLSALDFWSSGFSHCDMHFANIMNLAEYVSDPVQLLTMLKDGTVMSADIMAYYSERSLPKDLVTKLETQPARVFRLGSDQVRFIDNAYFLHLEPKDVDTAPCFLHRGRRLEDLFELYRAGLKLAFEKDVKGSPAGPMTILKKAPEIASNLPVWADATVALAGAVDASDPLTMFQKWLPEEFSILSETMKTADELVQGLHDIVRHNKQLNDCMRQREAAVKLPWTQNTDPQTLLTGLQAIPCSLQTEKDGVTAMRTGIHAKTAAMLGSVIPIKFERPNGEEPAPAA